jgi:hypothetical protein
LIPSRIRVPSGVWYVGGTEPRNRSPAKDLGLGRRAEKGLVTYNNPVYLQQRHNVPSELLQNIAGIEGLAKKAAE